MPNYYNQHIGGLSDSSELYYNILVTNNNTGYDASGNSTTTLTARPLVFNENRSQPYINHANEYFMSVVRFNVDTPALPVFICEPVVGYNDPTFTIYNITITQVTYVGVNPFVSAIQTKNVTWIPENKTTTAPGIVPSNYSSNPYWYCSSYQYFLNLINSAIATTYAAITGSTTAHPPFLYIKNGIVTLEAQRGPFETTSSGLPDKKVGRNIYYQLFFNTSLYNLFSSLMAIKQQEPYTNLTSIPPSNTTLVNYYGLNYQLLFVLNPSGTNFGKIYTNLGQVPLTTHVDSVISTCEFSPLATWNPVTSIIFTTSSLPVLPELIATPVVYGPLTYNNAFYSDQRTPVYDISGNIKGYTSYISSTQQNANAIYILTDYVSSTINGTEYKPNINYEPISEYKLTDLFGPNAVSNLEISVYWKDKYDVIHPLLLGAGGSASLKIMFRKKDFNSVYI